MSCIESTYLNEIVMTKGNRLFSIEGLVGVSSPASMTIACSDPLGHVSNMDWFANVKQEGIERMNCTKIFSDTTAMIIARTPRQRNLYHRYTSEWYPAFFIPFMFNISRSSITYVRLDNETAHAFDEIIQREGFKDSIRSFEIPNGEMWCYNNPKFLVGNYYFWTSTEPGVGPLTDIPIPHSPPYLSLWADHMRQLFGVIRDGSSSNALRIKKAHHPFVLFLKRSNRKVVNLGEVKAILANTTQQLQQQQQQQEGGGVNNSAHIMLHEAELHKMPIEEQVRLISKVDILVSMHGAGLTWTPAIQEGGAVVELYPPFLFKPHYFLMALGSKKKYYRHNLTLSDATGPTCTSIPFETLLEKMKSKEWDGRACDYVVDARAVANLIATAVQDWHMLHHPEHSLH